MENEMNKMKFKHDFHKLLASALDVVYYPAWWNPLYGRPKYEYELNIFELMFFGVRRQEIKPMFTATHGRSTRKTCTGAAGAAFVADADSAPVGHMHEDVNVYEAQQTPPEMDLTDIRCPVNVIY